MNTRYTSKLKKPVDELLERFPANEKIIGQQVRLLTDDGQPPKVLATRDALYLARNQGLDLVIINSTASPIVAKIIDYSKFLYDQRRAKKEQDKKNRANAILTKEIQLRPVTGDHDIEVKVNHAKEFLEENNKVKFVIKFKARELGFASKGFELIRKIIDGLGPCKLEKQPELNGRMITTIVAPIKKENK
jgi:translation initiation factor IF-3